MSGQLNWTRINKENQITQAGISAYINKLNAGKIRSGNYRKVRKEVRRSNSRRSLVYTYHVVKSILDNQSDWIPLSLAKVLLRDGHVSELLSYSQIIDKKEAPSKIRYLPIDAIPYYVEEIFWKLLTTGMSDDRYQLEDKEAKLRWYFTPELVIKTRYQRPKPRHCPECHKEKVNLAEHYRVMHPKKKPPL